LRKKCLFLTTLLLGFQLVFIGPSWPAEPNKNNKLLVSTLKDLQWTIIEKIEYETDTTATAFADAERIDRDLRLKDLFRTPLVIIEETINTIGSLINARRLSESAQQVLDSSQTDLQIASTIMSISTSKQVGENLQLAIDGPTYCSTIEEMLDKAYRRSSTRIKFNPDAYKTVIKDYLYAQYEPGPLRILRKSTDLTRRNFEIVSGTHAVQRSIRKKFRALIDNIEHNPLSPDSALQATNHIEKIKIAIVVSKGSYQKVNYETYLKDETGSYIPNTVDSRLGSIAELEKMRRIALANSDRELMIEQINTISRAVRAGIQATTLHIHTKYKSPKTGKILGEVQKWSLVPSMIELGISEYFDTNAREQVNMIPQEMMMTLPLELSNVWMVAGDTASYIEYLIETQKEQPPKPVPPETEIPAEIKLKDKSIIKGEIEQEKIKIKTKYGEMNIPVENFISIIGQLIELKDGTTLKGNFVEKTLIVKTDYGKLKIQTKDIDFIIFAKEKPPVEPLPPSEEKIPIPVYHGVYLVADGNLIQLKENTTLLGEHLPSYRQVLVGIETLSGVNVPGNVYIIIYDPLAASLVARGQLDRLFLSRLRYIDRDSPISVLPPGGPRETWANMWLAETGIRETGIRFKTTPVEDRNDMYYLIPVSTLPPGVYALLVIRSRIPEEVLAFDFTVNYEKDKQDLKDLKIQAEKHFELGKSYFEKDQYDNAIKEFEKVLQIQPINAEAHYYLGRCYHSKERYDKAIPHLKKAIQIQPSNADAHYYLARCYHFTTKFDEAIEEFKKVIQMRPNDFSSHELLGASYQFKKMYDSAIRELKKAIEIQPDIATAHARLGSCYYEKKMYDEAIAQVNNALELLKTIPPSDKRSQALRKKVEEFLQELKAEKKQKAPKVGEKVHETAKIEKAPSNVALSKPCTVITNGAEDYSDAHQGEWPRDITDGSLTYEPVSSGREDGCIAWDNRDIDQLLVVTVTIDLEGTYNITKIRYNPGNCERAETWNADIMESPFGRTPTNPGTSYRGTWTEQTGSITASKVTIKLEKTRRSYATNWLFIGEIEVLGTPVEVTTPRISARKPWTDTGIDLKEGEKILIVAKGTWDASGSDAPEPDLPCGPEGIVPPKWVKDLSPYPYHGRRIHELLGKIGRGKPFYVGKKYEGVVEKAGRLYLGINDWKVSDNDGHLDVRVEIEK